VLGGNTNNPAKLVELGQPRPALENAWKASAKVLHLRLFLQQYLAAGVLGVNTDNPARVVVQGQPRLGLETA